MTNITAVSVRCERRPQWATIHSAMPQVENELREQLLPLEAAAISTLRHRSWREATSLTAAGTFQFATEATMLRVTLEDTIVAPLSFGNSAEILNFDGAIERLIQEDLETWQECLGIVAPTTGPQAIRRSLRRAVKDFMLSEIHQDMVDLLNKKQRPAAVSSSLRGGLSSAYVDQARTALAAATLRQKRFIEFFPWLAVTLATGAAWLPVSLWFAGHEDNLGRFALPLAVLVCLGGWWIVGVLLAAATSFIRFAIIGGKRLSIFSFEQNDISITPSGRVWRWLLYGGGVLAGLAINQPQMLSLPI